MGTKGREERDGHPLREQEPRGGHHQSDPREKYAAQQAAARERGEPDADGRGASRGVPEHFHTGEANPERLGALGPIPATFQTTITPRATT